MGSRTLARQNSPERERAAIVSGKRAIRQDGRCHSGVEKSPPPSFGQLIHKAAPSLPPKASLPASGSVCSGNSLFTPSSDHSTSHFLAIANSELPLPRLQLETAEEPLSPPISHPIHHSKGTTRQLLPKR